MSTAFTYGLACHELTPEEFAVDDPYNPSLVTVRAVKPIVADREPEAPESGSRSRPQFQPRVTTAPSAGAAVLLYHGIGDQAPDPHGLWVKPSTFRAQLQHLCDHYDLLALADLTAALDAGSLDPRAVALRFDDGYVDNDGDRSSAHWSLYHALAREPAAVRDPVIATLNEWSGLGSSGRSPRRRMNRSEFEDLSSRPGHTVGAHGVHHQMLSGLGARQQQDEIARSKMALEGLLDRSVVEFAYPFGAYD